MKCYGLTDKGTVRNDNQDSFIIEKCPEKGCTILALCDGMGGANAGSLASRLANKAFVSYIFDKLISHTQRRIDYRQMLQNACDEANGVAFEYSKFDEKFNGMGTTIVGGLIKKSGKGYIINVGDSRLYLISQNSRSIKQVTTDHSLVQELVECGAITKEEARSHPKKNVITRALGAENNVVSDYYEIQMEIRDLLIFCSDGLSNTLTEDDILQCALECAEPETLCRKLMEMALDKGANDNITVLVAAR